MTDDDLKAFVRACVHEEIRKALDEERRLARIDRGIPPAYYPPRMETKAAAPPRHEALPTWARHAEGTGH